MTKDAAMSDYSDSKADKNSQANANNAENIASPCVRNCCLDQKDICIGCHRSLAEILEWERASPQRRLTIIDVAKQRAKH